MLYSKQTYTKAIFRFLTIGLTMCILASCASPTSQYKPFPAMPVEPEWQVFSRAPIVSVTSDGAIRNFVVSDEFIVKAGQQQDYTKRIKTWKIENAIP